MNLRDKDIYIATLLGQYKKCQTVDRWYYTHDPNVNSGCMAGMIFPNGVAEDLQWDHDEYTYEPTERRWWQSETNPELWYTGAVPQYTTNLLEAYKLINYMMDKKVVVCIEHIPVFYNDESYYRIYLKNVSSLMICGYKEKIKTLPETICEIFIKWMEHKNGN